MPFDFVLPETAPYRFTQASPLIAVAGMYEGYVMATHLEAIRIFVDDLEPAGRAIQIHRQHKRDPHRPAAKTIAEVTWPP